MKILGGRYVYVLSLLNARARVLSVLFHSRLIGTSRSIDRAFFSMKNANDPIVSIVRML